MQKRNLSPFSLKKMSSYFQQNCILAHCAPSQMAFGCLSETVQERTYVNPPSEKSVNVNAATELGARK